MRRSTRLAEKQDGKPEKEAQQEPEVKKSRSDSRVSNIATFDNDTLLEAFKHLNYCQLATSSLVSKRYRDVIQTHRHSLALLDVDEILIFKSGRADKPPFSPSTIKVFGKQLFRKEYNEWIICNRYSKQIPQVVGMESRQDHHNYLLYACYKRTSHSQSPDSILRACTALNDETWPVVEHFVRLLTDPFICIRNCDVQLTSQNDVLNLLIGAMHQDHNRLQCKSLSINDLDNNMQKFMSWTKDHVRCNKFISYEKSFSNYDAEFLDFFMTGANCTPIVNVQYYDLSNVVIDLVQKFMNLKSSDGYQFVEYIVGSVKEEIVEMLKRNYAGSVTNRRQFYQPTIAAKKMRRSPRLAKEHYAKPEKEAQQEPEVKKSRSDGRVSNIAAFDNDTMIEAFKHLSYRQLAISNIVSKRYRDLIRAHRHSLALLDVDEIRIFKSAGCENSFCSPSTIKVFGKQLSRKEYDEWIIRNEYSKQIPVEGQVVGMEGTQDDGNYHLWAYAYYKKITRLQRSSPNSILRACTALNNETWPVFEHFVRLLTDPFISIRNCDVQLTSQNDVLNLLIGAMHKDHNRLQCKSLMIHDLSNNMQKFMNWTKDHVHCDKFISCGKRFSNYDAEFLDFFMTGANCTPKVDVSYDLSKVVIDLVQKFMDLKSSDGYQVVESIEGNAKEEIVEMLMRNYADSLVRVTRRSSFQRRGKEKFVPFLPPDPKPPIFFGFQTKVEDGLKHDQVRSRPGIVWEILLEMARSLNLTYEVEPLDCPERHNSNTQDNWDCAFNKLSKGSADIIVGGSVMRGKNNKSDVTFPFFHQKSGILIRSSEYSNFVSMALFEAFSKEVWMAVIISIFIAFLFLRITHIISSSILEGSQRKYSAIDSFWIIFSIFTRQTFRGLLEALKDDRYKVVMDMNSRAQARMIQTKNYSLVSQLRYEIEVNKKVVYIDGIMNGVNLVQTQRGYALIASMDVLDILAKVDCNIVLLEEPILSTYITIPVRKGSPYKDYLNRRIPQLMQHGFIEKWTRNYIMSLGAKSRKTCQKRNLWNLPLKQYRNIFWFLIFGLCISMFLFICELLIRKYRSCFFF
ncbi:CRE-GLR-8 protein [Ditylenchus destructor]|nr:CRE-GLR-8 protein [Ditylenchus destructor]